MRRIAALALWGTLGAAFGQPGSGGSGLLARRLADLATRDAAVEEVVASSAILTPVLLSWTTNPPNGVSASDLNIGMAEAFDRMKTESAVPFLIRVISIKRFPWTLAPWIKGAPNVELEYPAAEALIRIGPTAAEAVIKAAKGPMTPEERLLAIFVVGQTHGVPGAREFLMSALVQANGESIWAGNGLELLKKEEKGRDQGK